MTLLLRKPKKPTFETSRMLDRVQDTDLLSFLTSRNGKEVRALVKSLTEEQKDILRLLTFDYYCRVSIPITLTKAQQDEIANYEKKLEMFKSAQAQIKAAKDQVLQGLIEQGSDIVRKTSK